MVGSVFITHETTHECGLEVSDVGLRTMRSHAQEAKKH